MKERESERKRERDRRGGGGKNRAGTKKLLLHLRFSFSGEVAPFRIIDHSVKSDTVGICGKFCAKNL